MMGDGIICHGKTIIGLNSDEDVVTEVWISGDRKDQI
jgi:hypothetical protein